MYSLILIPSEPIRQNWIRHYRALERKLQALKADWQRFEQESRPLYQSWYYSTFAEELARVNVWSEKARKQDIVLSAIVAHMRLYGVTELEAYRQVRSRMRSGLDPYPDREDLEEFERERQAEQARRREREERNRERRDRKHNAHWEEVERRLREEAAARDAEFAGATVAAEPDAREVELKAVYRKIVRALHPDSGHEMSATEREWWYQAQDAYRYHDLETLKLIALKIQGDGKVSIDQVDHISTLIELCQSLMEQESQLKVQKRRLKRDPVFRFWSSRNRPKNRLKLQLELRRQLELQYEDLRQFVDQAKNALRELDKTLHARSELHSFR